MTSPYERSSLPSGLPPDEAAAHWLAKQDAGMSEVDEREFDRWLLADETHAAAWERAEAVWQSFDEARRSGQAADMVRELARRKHRRRWRNSFAIAATAAAAALVVFLGRPAPTAHGVISRIEERTLEDGSVVELDRDARIDVRYEPQRRLVRLLHGTALFKVAKNATRPFVVSTGAVDVQAVGTAFSVQANATVVDVIVTEGKVAVERTTSPSPAPAESVLVASGNRVTVPLAPTPGERLEAEPVTDVEMARALAWREPRIELASTRLADAAVLFNAENRVQMRVTDERLAGLRLSGVFRARDAEGFIRLLEANYNVLAQRSGDEVRLSGK